MLNVAIFDPVSIPAPNEDLEVLDLECLDLSGKFAWYAGNRLMETISILDPLERDCNVRDLFDWAGPLRTEYPLKCP